MHADEDIRLDAEDVRRLSAAIVLSALQDARAGDVDAARWLGSPWCAMLCEGAGVDPRTARAYGRHYARRRRRVTQRG